MSGILTEAYRMNMEMPLVELVNVSKTYPNGKVAVEDVNLSIYEGEFISFVGPSGCGKSTIFKMIAGMTEQTKGELSLFGESSRFQNGEVGFVFQDSTLLPWRSVLDNVLLPLELKKMNKKRAKEEARHALNLVGLSDYEHVLPRQLSGGMKMRVSIARALVGKPKLLLMDEPFAALDEMTRQHLQYELLKIWKKEKMTILFITHNVFEAVYLSTRIGVMTSSPGKLREMVNVPIQFPRENNIRGSHEFSDLVSKVSNVLQD